MRDNGRYHFLWLSSILMLLLLLTGCSKSSDNSGDEPQPGKAVLKVYVFAPDRPVVTRADNGDVDASKAENEIKNLHVWVYRSDNQDLVGHISLNNVELSQAGKEVSMELNDNYAALENKPNVDVYVAANVSKTNCGLTFDASTTSTQLKDALIKEGYFGVSNLIKTVPADGLPMSGVMLNKPVGGSNPVYQVRESTEGTTLANVRLVRAVSKIRFIACKSSTNPDAVTVNSVKLNADVLPKEQYLFLDNAYDLATPKWKVNTEAGYVAETELVAGVTELAVNDSPTSYSWDGTMTGQAYESKIQKGIDDGELTDLGTFYLRESDKKLAGTIKYTIKHTEAQKNGTEDPIESSPAFSMNDEGDFSRNHTWIVYAYFISSGDLILAMVEVMNWTSSENTSQSVYNW